MIGIKQSFNLSSWDDIASTPSLNSPIRNKAYSHLSFLLSKQLEDAMRRGEIVVEFDKDHFTCDILVLTNKWEKKLFNQHSVQQSEEDKDIRRKLLEEGYGLI